LRNAARVGPGHSPGLISILGNYTQTATGTLDIEIGGLSPGLFDQVNINGLATLDGVLNVTLIDGFVPQTDNSFKIMSFAAHTGSFAIKNGLNRGGGLYLAPSFATNDFTLSPRNAGDTVAPALTFTTPRADGFTNSLAAIAGTATDNAGGSGMVGVALIIQRRSDNKYWNGTTATWVTITASASPPALPATLNADTSTINWSRDSNLPGGAGLLEGLYTLRAIADDGVFNRTAVAINVTVDKKPPVSVNFTAPLNGRALAALGTIGVTAADATGGSGIGRVNLLLQRNSDGKYWDKIAAGWVGVASAASAPVLSTTLAGGIWTLGSSLPGGTNLPDGTYTLTATAYDKAGNNNSSTITVTVDKTAPPTINFTAPTSNNVLTSLAATTGTAADNAGGSGLAAVTVQLYRYANTRIGTIGGYWGGGSNWATTYTAAHERVAIGTTAWSLTLPTPAQGLTSGRYRLRATGKDRAGNANISGYVYFTVDPTAPASISFTTPINNEPIVGLPLVNITASDDSGGSGIAHVELTMRRNSDSRFWTGANATGWGTMTALSTTLSKGVWSRARGTSGNLPGGANLPDGAYTLTATAYDQAGNSKSTAITVTVDATAPTVNIALPVAGAVYSGLASAAGNASDNGGSGIASVTLLLYRYGNTSSGVTAGYWAGNSNWTAAPGVANEQTATGLANWSLLLPTPAQGLTPGQYRLRATATDRAGNLVRSAYVYFTIDPNAPTAVSITTPRADAVISSLPSISGTAADNNNGSGISRVELVVQRSSDGLYWTGSTWGVQTALTTTLKAALNGSNATWTRATGLPAGIYLLNGSYALTATAYDKAGNSKSTAVTVTIDKTAPMVSVARPIGEGIYRSQSTATGTASDEGTGVASVTAQLFRYANATTGTPTGYWAGGSTWTATYTTANELLATGTTNWNFALPTPAQGLTSGSYRLRVTAIDGAGNLVRSSYINFTIDADAPAAVSFRTPVNEALLTSLASISGAATDSSGGSGISNVELVMQRSSDGLYWTWATWDTQTALTTTLKIVSGSSGVTWTRISELPAGADLPDGDYKLTATAYDKAGNSQRTAITITIDKTAPAVNIAQPVENGAYSSLSSANGTASDSSGRTLTSVTVSLYRYANSSTGLTAGYWAGGSIWSAGYGAANEVLADGTTNWQRTLPTPGQGLTSGSYRLRATATDGAGNLVRSSYVTFTIDSVPTSIIFTEPADGASLETLTSVSGIATENAGGSGVDRVELTVKRNSDNLYWSGSAWGDQTALTTTLTSISSGLKWTRTNNLPSGVDLLDGDYTLRTTVYDKAGNSQSATITITVDNTAPTLTVTEPAPGGSYSSLSAATGTTEDTGGSGVTGVTVRLYRAASDDGIIAEGYWNGSSWDATYSTGANEVPADGTANWSLTLPTPEQGFAPGQYQLRATARDAAGNIARSDSIAFTMTNASASTTVVSSDATRSRTAAALSTALPRHKASAVTYSTATARSAGASVRISFSGGLDADTAVDVAHYTVKVNGVTVVIERASYTGSTQAVTLGLPQGTLATGDSVVISWSGLLDTRGKSVTGQSGLLTVR